MTTVNLTSSDGRFEMSVAAEDAELIASMLLLLEVPRQHAVESIESARSRLNGRSLPPRPAEAPIALAS